MAEFSQSCCTECIDARLGLLNSNYGKGVLCFIGGVAIFAVGLVFHGPIGPGNEAVGITLITAAALAWLMMILNFVRQCCGVDHVGESDEVYSGF